MNIRPTGIVLAALSLAATASTAIAEPAATSRYFAFEASGAPLRQSHEFVVQIDDPATADMARQVLDGQDNHNVRIGGVIVKGSTDYNESWAYHLDPKSIQFSANAVEVCDATAQYVNEHLHLVGTDFLPRNEWCPWSARLTREVKYP
jgi:hypothetical protein